MDLSALNGPWVDHLGLKITELTGSKVVAEWTASTKHHQPYGIVHGGVYASVVESLGSIGSAVWFGERGKVVGVSNSTDFFRAVSEGAMVSTATPIHQGRSQQVWVVEIHDAEGRLISRGQLRVQNLEGR
jgi:uncharacterized protein (TIGR00369 family)